MTLKEGIYDVRHILKALATDTEVKNAHVAQKFHEYRAIEILTEYHVMGEVNPLWIQNYGKTVTTTVTSSDNQETVSSVCLSKVTLPPVIKLPRNRGVYRIANSSNQKSVYEISQQLLWNKIEANDFTVGDFDFYYQEGNEYFFYPKLSACNPHLILANPLDGYVMTTESVLSGSIIADAVYTITSGTITYNGVNYITSDTFTGVSGVNTFTGGGQVKFFLNKRGMTVEDEYPCDIGMMEKIVLNILTKDFGIEQRQVADYRNDTVNQRDRVAGAV